MTMALLSLLLGCFNQPVVVTVSNLPNGEFCGASLLYAKGEDGSRKVENGLHSGAKKMVERCCTSRGGEHVGWNPIASRLYPVCLYR